MLTPAKKYRAICFDLDGTLLPMDLDEFMGSYFKSIAQYVTTKGLDTQAFLSALKQGTRAMAVHESDVTNAEEFWRVFKAIYKEETGGACDMEQVMDVVNDFYETEFPKIGASVEPHPAVARIVSTLTDKGYPLLLTTMPMFPLRAVEHRLAWAGVDAQMFTRITNYENSKAVKPRQTYYAENLAAAQLSGEDVLMVGNNTQEDLAFCSLGADAFLVTDYLLDPIDFDLNTVRHGSMEEFEQWVNELPVCENPACDIDNGPISAAMMEKAFEENVQIVIARSELNEATETIARDVTGRAIDASMEEK